MLTETDRQIHEHTIKHIVNDIKSKNRAMHNDSILAKHYFEESEYHRLQIEKLTNQK